MKNKDPWNKEYWDEFDRDTREYWWTVIIMGIIFIIGTIVNYYTR